MFCGNLWFCILHIIWAVLDLCRGAWWNNCLSVSNTVINVFIFWIFWACLSFMFVGLAINLIVAMLSHFGLWESLHSASCTWSCLFMVVTDCWLQPIYQEPSYDSCFIILSACVGINRRLVFCGNLWLCILLIVWAVTDLCSCAWWNICLSVSNTVIHVFILNMLSMSFLYACWARY